MAISLCAHCGSPDVMTQVDAYQCLACGFHTSASDGSKMAKPPTHVAPSPAAQRLMHAPGNNDGVHPELEQVGEASWSEHVDPTERYTRSEDR